MPTPAVKRIEVARRRERAIELRIAGWQWQAIADELGYSDRGAACKDVSRALEAAHAEMKDSAAALVQLENERLDAVQRVAMEVMSKDHIHVSNGRIVRHEDGSPVLDDGPKLAAVGKVVQVSESRRKLLGLDAPTKQEITGQELKITVVGVDIEAMQ